MESVTTEAKTKSAMSPTATMPERSEATTSQETTTSMWFHLQQPSNVLESAELSTTDVATKTATRPMTTVSATTTSQETTASTCSSPPVDCEFGGSSYNFSTRWMDHASAVLACSQFGSHLVFIESQEEENFMIMEHGQYNYYWIGLTGSSPSEARWLDGSSPTYNNFSDGSFNDHGNCFSIKCGGQYSGWHDWYCSWINRFICEKEV
ncbi:collectin-12-like [Strongylocentrotus purpuratus]|uniref:C-type lectin domain-containing protein n=1 Tax=Strongylocentrotus purpuratus TaxID=7668 RepID=A0A7M7NNY5_STRPU|nr:collectin-12-like [Strongylocentrotus purpuratus]